MAKRKSSRAKKSSELSVRKSKSATSLSTPEHSDQGLSQNIREEIRAHLLGGNIYSRLMSRAAVAPGAAQNEIRSLASGMASDRYAQITARTASDDPFEEMLVEEALWTHARLARLTDMACSAAEPENVRILNEACDRASNTYRRLMLALADYRTPGRRGNPPVNINQANMATNQIVNNGVSNQSEEK